MNPTSSPIQAGRRLVTTCWLAAGFFALPTMGVFLQGTPISGIWALGLVGIFLTISALVCGVIFRLRAKKLENLLFGEQVLASWNLDAAMQKDYADLASQEGLAKNSAMLMVIGSLFVVITIPFLFLLDSGERLDFVAIMAAIFAVVAAASRFFPWYYRRKNLTADGLILIGAKYAYINGYLHNWDFPLSGLNKVKIVTSPLKALQIVYYTTDRTFKRDHQLTIPAPPSVDLDLVVAALLKAN